jgi:hypothetical protein
MQATAAALGWLVPAGQSAQDAALKVEYWPARQVVQVVDAVAPMAADALPAPQPEQLPLPALAWKVPVGQDAHALEPVLAAKDPASQTVQPVPPELSK